MDLDFNSDIFIVPPSDYVDASVLKVPKNKALVQSVDFFTPIVNNPYWFGQIAAANSLSDIYAMGGVPFAVMNLVCFPVKKMSKNILKEILKGGLDKVREAGAVMAGGHSVEDEEIKYGLSVTGVIDQGKIAKNSALQKGDFLVLTKPIGTGVLATALKGEIGDEKIIEETLYKWCARLNSRAGEAISYFGLKAATDITGFGLGGHLLEMARASKVKIELWANEVPVLDQAKEMAAMGIIPAGSYANKHFCSRLVYVYPQVDELLVDLIFDAQTSGGLVLGVKEDILEDVLCFLKETEEFVKIVGQVVEDSISGSLVIK
ncbi:selenophosphate synthase [Desulfonauticus submarinus]|uniref:Selenophosphate synthase n=1 Tax=Desulfonauticus submarinus TaxID=206665 RepID=A0A1H0G3U2_9BACT|nr:selenophosphate synthase [Desulfonauticus submarinus]